MKIRLELILGFFLSIVRRIYLSAAHNTLRYTNFLWSMAAFLFAYIWNALDIALRTYPGEGLN